MKRHLLRGYSLIELLATTAVLSVSGAAAASLVGSMTLQEDYARRVSVVRNYQENMSRLWQLGLSESEVLRIMPTPAGNPALSGVVFGIPRVISQGEVSLGADGGATVEVAICRAAVNIAQSANPFAQEKGAEQEITVCRPTIR